MERKLNLPALGRTPYVSEEIPEEIEDPFSPISEAYASIRATLDHAVRRDHPVIQLTSSEAGEGKTTSAVALARKYASTGRKVLLVDLDLRRPGLAKMFGDTKPETGVVDVLYSRVPLERALLPNTIENLDILPVGSLPDNPVEVMSSGLIAEFIERYRGQYDVTILDSSPVMGIADAPLLSRHADAVAFVVEANRAQISKARIALRRLEDMNANLVGLILTKFRALEAGENYNYEQHYYSYNSRTP
jgi:capsular exopolysaccharide synthesis family protein